MVVLLFLFVFIIVVVCFLGMCKLMFCRIVGECGLLYWKFIFFRIRFLYLGKMVIFFFRFFLLLWMWILLRCLRFILVFCWACKNLNSWFRGEFICLIMYWIFRSIFSDILLFIIVLVIMKMIRRFLVLLKNLELVCCICLICKVLIFVWNKWAWICFYVYCFCFLVLCSLIFCILLMSFIRLFWFFVDWLKCL